jgi:hypothetical protein
MNADKMRWIGELRQKHWKGEHEHLTDAELADQVEALELVITYLDGRGDAGFCTDRLRSDLRTFIDYQYARRRKP